MTEETSRIPVPTAFLLGLEEGPHTLHVLDNNNKPVHLLADIIHRTLLTFIVYRICPGLHFAENSIWIAIATILYCFEIKKARDENGVEIEPVIDFDGFIRFVRQRLHTGVANSSHPHTQPPKAVQMRDRAEVGGRQTVVIRGLS
jgi:hypothetical protein